MAQIPPADVPEFFAAADKIAADLAANGPSEDELDRVVEPLRNVIVRALSGHAYWMTLLEGSTQDPRRIDELRSLMADYTAVTPVEMKALAQKYLAARKGYRIAVIPEGQVLATSMPTSLAGR
jgi:zinc protease